MGNSRSKTVTTPAKPQVDLSTLPARVDNVKIAGLNRTYDDYIQRAAGGLFKATTFEDILLEANDARSYLDDLGIFKSIDIKIDVTKENSKTPYSYDVTFKGKELSRIVGGIGTEIGQNEGSLTMQLSTPNIWGRGEKLTLQGSYSNIKTNDITLKLAKPFYHTRFMDNRPEIALSLFRHSDRVDISAFKNSNFGLIVDFSFLTNFPFELSHSLQYESSIREITVLGKSVPFFVRNSCGPRMASLIRHIVCYDSRNNSVFPSYGILIKTTNEVCGFGGNIGFMMNNTQAEINIPLFNGFVASICSRFGLIQRDKRHLDIPISSLFVFGGNQTLRGFQYGGAGRHVDGYAAGAHSYWSTGLHLWGPLPFSSTFGRFSSNFRTHLFYNFGNADSFSTDNMRSAAGIGIAYKFADRARIELNYCYPINKERGDKIYKGFQFGIGYEFI